MNQLKKACVILGKNPNTLTVWDELDQEILSKKITVILEDNKIHHEYDVICNNYNALDIAFNLINYEQ